MAWIVEQFDLKNINWLSTPLEEVVLEVMTMIVTRWSGGK